MLSVLRNRRHSAEASRTFNETQSPPITCEGNL